MRARHKFHVVPITAQGNNLAAQRHHPLNEMTANKAAATGYQNPAVCKCLCDFIVTVIAAQVLSPSQCTPHSPPRLSTGAYLQWESGTAQLCHLLG
jgi:hypothetical protein